MIKHLSFTRVAMLSIAMVVSLFAFTGGAGAQTIGSKCVSNSGAPTTLLTTATGSGESYVVPFDGVLTEWGSDRTANGDNVSMFAAILGTKSGNDWTIAAMTEYRYTTGGSAGAVSYSARIPVKAGQTLGSTTFNSMPVMCETGSPLEQGAYGSAYAAGESFAENSISGYKAAIWANIEPDIDNDGFGDETQDKCPQSAAYIDVCPVLSIGQKLSASNKQITVLASATTNALLTAKAVVAIPKIGRSKARNVTISSKATQFTAGRLATIRLKLPSSVKRALKKKGRLKATVSTSGDGIANKSTATSKITLKK